MSILKIDGSPAILYIQYRFSSAILNFWSAILYIQYSAGSAILYLNSIKFPASAILYIQYSAAPLYCI